VLRLILVVVWSLGVELRGSILQLVGLGCSLTFCDHFLDSAFSVCAVYFF
jgi:hypothetical protein